MVRGPIIDTSFTNDAMSVGTTMIASFVHRRRSKKTANRDYGPRTFGKVVLEKWRNSFQSRENDLCIFPSRD